MTTQPLSAIGASEVAGKNIRDTHSMLKKTAILALILSALLAYITLDLGQWLTLDSMHQWIHDARTWRDRYPFVASLGYFFLYVSLTALSLPGATILTLAGGALFGLVWGLLLISFASSLGATLAFLAARFVLGHTVQQRFGERLHQINAGVQKDGALYLFSLRLVPIFPFFLVNLVMGLTPIRVRTFYWVSQLGMLPGTLVYTNAGTRLANLETLQDIISPALLGSFIAIGLLPLAARFAVRGLTRWQSRHAGRNPWGSK